MALKRFQFSGRFFEERCDGCGVCLEQCPVLELPHDEAQTEMWALIHAGRSRVLAECTGCMACNALCPKDADPHTLIVTRWNERYRKEGIPVRGRLVLPYQRPNVYTLVIERLPPDEKALVEKWEDNWRRPQGHDTMIYAGCNLLLQPFLLDSPLYDGLPVFGSPDLCCGEPLYRMGCWDAAKTVAERLRGEFGRLGLKKMVVPCLAGYHLFRYVYPEVFHVPLDLEIVSLVEWIRDRLSRGEIPVSPINKRAVIHDSCWPKASGERLFDATRDVLRRLGIAVVEPRHTRATALCCGMCAPAARFSLMDALRASRKRLSEFENCDADMVIVDCAGCNWLFAVVNKLSFTKMTKPVYDLLEVVRMGIGETPRHRTDQRAGQIVRAMAGRLFSGYLTRGRFRIDDIRGTRVETPE